jgi:hypothetical protein
MKIMTHPGLSGSLIGLVIIAVLIGIGCAIDNSRSNGPPLERITELHEDKLFYLYVNEDNGMDSNHDVKLFAQLYSHFLSENEDLEVIDVEGDTIGHHSRNRGYFIFTRSKDDLPESG